MIPTGFSALEYLRIIFGKEYTSFDDRDKPTVYLAKKIITEHNFDDGPLINIKIEGNQGEPRI